MSVAEEKKKRTDALVKINANLACKAKIIATHKEITIAEYLSSLLENPLSKDYKKVVKEMNEEE